MKILGLAIVLGISTFCQAQEKQSLSNKENWKNTNGKF